MAAANPRQPYNMSKCNACRKAHAKCAPPHPHWDQQSSQKCQRCNARGVECSGPTMIRTRRAGKGTGGGRPAETQATQRPPEPDVPQSPPRRHLHSFQSQPSTLGVTESDRSNQSRYRSRIHDCYGILAKHRYLKSAQESTANLGDGTPKDYSTQASNCLDRLKENINILLTKVVSKIDLCDGITVHTVIDCLNHVQRYAGVRRRDLECDANRRKATLLQNNTLGGELVGSMPFYELALHWDIHSPQAFREREASSRRSTPTDSASDVSSEPGGLSVLICSDSNRSILRDLQDLPRASSYNSRASRHQNRDSTSPKASQKNGRRHKSAEIPPEFLAFAFGTVKQAQSWLLHLAEVVELEDLHGRRISHVAAQHGKLHLLKDIIMDDRYKSKLDRCDARKLWPTMVSVIHDDLDGLKLLIKAGYRTDGRDLLGRNLLALAALHRRLEIVEHLLREGLFPVNDYDGAGKSSAIHAAIDAKSEEICEELFKYNVDLGVEFRGENALSYAQEKSPKCLGPLLQKYIQSQAGNQAGNAPFASFQHPLSNYVASRSDPIFLPQYPNPPLASPQTVANITDSMFPGPSSAGILPVQCMDESQHQPSQSLIGPSFGPMETYNYQQSQYPQYQQRPSPVQFRSPSGFPNTWT